MIKQYGNFELMHFSKKSCRLSSAGPETAAFDSHCPVNFRPILSWFLPNGKLKYGDSENLKTDLVNAVVFNLPKQNQDAVYSGSL